MPLAPARLAAAAGLPPSSVFPERLLDSLGDSALLSALLERDPWLIGVTLYMWNRERTLNLLREYRKLRPDVLIVAGGPEVTPDNRSLLSDTSVDLFVAGEGESLAGEVLHREGLSRLISSGIRITGPVMDTLPPDRWPDPYETGHLIPSPGSSAHVETQRGCGCLCSYCAYRRTSPRPRVTSAKSALRKIRMLKEKGAGELVFLDPTFNARPDLAPLLSGMAELDMSCFAEVRGDLAITDSTARSLRKAGFHSLEVGLQTVNADVLRDIGRGGSPQAILRGAGILRDCGITPVIDLILGLPGDYPGNIVLAAEKIRELGLEEQVQTFLLSVLPGTELRAKAGSLSLSFDDRPPYPVTRSGGHTLNDLLAARDCVSDILGYDADPPPRPVLCDGFPGMEVFTPGGPPPAAPPSSRHGVLRIVTEDPWNCRNEIMDRLALRRGRDPYCPLDVVIDSAAMFPLDLLDMIAGLGEPMCYERAKAEIYGVPGLLRLAVIAGPDADCSWLEECSRSAVTVVRSPGPAALPGGETGLLIQGIHDLAELSALYAGAPHLIFFTDPGLERLWNLDILGLG